MRSLAKYLGYCLIALGAASLLAKTLFWLTAASDLPVFAAVGAVLLFPSFLVGFAFYAVGIEQPLFETGSHFPVITLIGVFLLFLLPGSAVMAWGRAGSERAT